MLLSKYKILLDSGNISTENTYIASVFCGLLIAFFPPNLSLALIYFFVFLLLVVSIWRNNSMMLISSQIIAIGLEMLIRILTKKSDIGIYNFSLYYLFFSSIVYLLSNFKAYRVALLRVLVITFIITLSVYLSSDYTFSNFYSVMGNYGIYYINIFSLLILYNQLEIDKSVIIRYILTIFISSVILTITYNIIHLPNLSDYKFELKSKDDVTAGFGVNQVISFYGLGVVSILYSIIYLKENFLNKLILWLILPVLLFVIMISFTRGPMVIVLIVTLLLLLKEFKSVKNLQILVFFLILVSACFFLSNKISNGVFLKRYEMSIKPRVRKDALSNFDKKVFNASKYVNFSGREQLFVIDWYMIKQSFPIPLGWGGSDKARFSLLKSNIKSHNEFTRLIIDFGFVGFLAILLFLQKTLYIQNKDVHIFTYILPIVIINGLKLAMISFFVTYLLKQNFQIFNTKHNYK